MGLWDRLTDSVKGQFLEVIEWVDDGRDAVVYRFPVLQHAIQDGSKLVVREGQAAVFLAEGKMSDVFGPGTYELSTRTKAIWSFFESIKYAFDQPYQGDVYFVSTRQYTAQKWGTPNPIPVRDADLGVVRIRGFGKYAWRVTDPAAFLREVVGAQEEFTTAGIAEQLKGKLVSALVDTLGELKIPVLDLVAQYMDLGDVLRQRLTGWFQENYGITLTDFVVESLSVPEEVEKMMDRRSSMALAGNMASYTQFQAANAVEASAKRPGGGSPLLDAGVGLAVGGAVGAQLGREMSGAGSAFNPHAGLGGGPPPVPGAPPSAAQLHYAGPDGQPVVLSPGDVVARVRAAPAARHLVWRDGMPGWVAADQLPELAALLGGPPAVPPPVPKA